MFYVMSSTPFGRSIYAVGSNKEAAKLSGINVNYVKMIIFAVTTMFAALAGVMTSAQVISGNPTLGQSWEFDVISAVIIGGTSLYGGSGTVRGTLIGCVFLGILLNAMTLMNVSDYWQFVLRGGLILVAVLINTQFKGRARA
jgi:ribose/xylose/arabinose/galactoside ABC-type transport system permease subunit